MFFKLKFVCFDNILSWIHKISGFSSAIRSLNFAFLFAFSRMFYRMIFAGETLRSWICGGSLIGHWFYICWCFSFLLSSLLSLLQFAVGRVGSFSFYLFLGIESEAVGRYRWWIVFTGFRLAFLLWSSWGFRCRSVKCVPYRIWGFWFRSWV